MKRWSLKVKVGAYAAILTMAALAVTAAVVLPTLHFHQLRTLDRELAEEASELQRDLQNFRGAPINPRRPVSANLIPITLQQRFLVLRGPEGQILYRSPNLANEELIPRAEGIETLTLLGRECRIGTFQRGPYLVQIGTGLEPIEKFDRTLRFGFLLALPIAGLVVFLGGVLLGYLAIKPVSDLTAAAELISASHPEERLPTPPSRDEIARLTEVLNRSFDRLQRSYEAAQRFSADASHQLKTPVAVLRNGLSALRQREDFEPKDIEEVDQLLQQTRRLSSLIDDLLLLAQADAGLLHLAREPLDLAPLVDASLDDLSALIDDRDISVLSEITRPLPATGDPRRVAVVLQNLIENAAKYSPDGGAIRVMAGRNEREAFIRVANRGTPIPEDIAENIFERFHRGQLMGEAVRGHGLGLNIARELARAHEGELVLLPTRDDWIEFEFRLPLPSE